MYVMVSTGYNLQSLEKRAQERGGAWAAGHTVWMAWVVLSVGWWMWRGLAQCEWHSSLVGRIS